MTFADLRRSKPMMMWSGPAFRLALDMLRYGSVSVAGLACDYGVLMLLISNGVHYLVASFLSFSAGSLVAYMLCIRFVFAARRGSSREAEAIGFFVVGLAGLALTQLLLWLFVSKLAIPVGWAKVPAVGIVFFFNFWFRRSFVFVRA